MNNINEDFNKFLIENENNKTGYLYLTAGKSKCGQFVSFFVQQGMLIEVIPNLFSDDDTINVRIPLTKKKRST